MRAGLRLRPFLFPRPSRAARARVRGLPAGGARIDLLAMTNTPAVQDEASPPALEDLHIVDQLIAERAVRLRRTPIWPAVRAVANPLLGYRRAVAMADAIAPLGGREVMDWCGEFLKLRLDASGVEHVPESGACVVIANHPGGISDGMAVWDTLARRRPDLCFFANRDALRVSPGVSSVVIPVEWRPAERTREKARETLRSSIDAFKSGRCIAIFPAGAMADWRWSNMGLRERPWASTAVSLARKYDAPIIPLGVRSRMSFWYYFFDQFSEELRNMTVFHEFLAKRNARYRLRFAPLIDPAALPGDDAAATEHLRTICEGLAWSGDAASTMSA